MSDLLNHEEYRALAASLTLPATAFIDGHFQASRSGKTFASVNPATGEALEIFALLVSIAFIGFFAKNAVQMTWDSYRFGDTSTGVVAVPLWIPQIGYASGLIILCIAMVDELVRVAMGQRPAYEKEPPSSPEELVERIASGGGA